MRKKVNNLDFRSTELAKVSRLDTFPTLVNDELAVEEPLEIRILSPSGGEHAVAVALRTPGDDFDLAYGLLITESLIDNPNEIVYIAWGEPADFNIVKVGVDSELAFTRISKVSPRFINSACGLCSKTTIDEITKSVKPITSSIQLGRLVLTKLPELLSEHQSNFERTGGVHAAGLFYANGTSKVVREDIGRHNCVDKVIGNILRNDKDWIESLSQLVLVVSGRIGFEIVNKAAMVGIPIIVGVSAASSMAIALANSLNITLAGFTRPANSTIYSGFSRIV